MTSATIRLENVTKTFDGRVVAVDGVRLDIADDDERVRAMVRFALELEGLAVRLSQPVH